MSIDPIQKRSSVNGCRDIRQNSLGVGGRHRNTPPPNAKGVCPDNYTRFETSLSENQLLDELKRTQLSRRLIELAEDVGVKQLLTVWQALDCTEDEENGRIHVNFPRYSFILRFQRNQVIRTLVLEGKSNKFIQAHVADNLKMSISIRHIQRLRRSLKEKESACGE
ncbi:hypothetical protein NO559_07940 [Dasania sp. GY-MA-18]|uniref:Uncharacterized protein n=1 Tax=Dasania phycosphaerae TaxID=2950436 RepID=A0A9J6RLR0_9GAMM|nr:MULTISPECIES: hypothetical protein [Dasania]MCR8922697.1 hypothetical protein [Dasania sp. GY-MA-18]MCZ0865127.1 hypothetical protein [Dasania phycosphaerae]MCZ0868853.1 hypothetical protein [Dasania phycosphaerae]